MQKLFLTIRTIFVHNMFSPCSAKRRVSDKDLPVADHHGSPQEEIEREAGHLLVPEEGPKIWEGSKEQAVF